MVILSGIDIVENERIKKLIEKVPSSINDIFSKIELEYCQAKVYPYQSFAARFAAKEALLKATDSHILRYNLSKIEVSNKNSGKPILTLQSEELTKKIQSLLGKQDFSINISLSHEKEYSIAEVIIY